MDQWTAEDCRGEETIPVEDADGFITDDAARFKQGRRTLEAGGSNMESLLRRKDIVVNLQAKLGW